jgi:membrane-associated phospholipid phosphatase
MTTRGDALPHPGARPETAVPAAPADAPRERAILLVVLFAFWAAGYYGVGLTRDPRYAHVLRTAWDDAVPFLPITIWIYCCVYTAMLLPLFTVRCRVIFRRVALAYAFVIGVSAICFAVYPVTSSGFRPALSDLADAPFHVWGLKLNLFLDPPVNLFPSLHLSIATLAAWTAWKVRRTYGVLAFALTAAIAVSVLTLKQHYWVDAVAGFALGSTAYTLFVRRSEAHAHAAYGWGGPLAYAVFHTAAIALLVTLYLAGFRPWAG